MTWSAMVSRRSPGDSAVITAEGKWDTRDLLRHAAGAAQWLDRLGVPEGSSVPALLSTSLAANALLVAGAASHRPLAPVGPRLTPGELASCLGQHDAPVVLTDPDFEDAARAAAAETGQAVAVVTEFPPSSAGHLDWDPPGEAVALIMHTSGTSGVPKLVPVRQDRLAARVRNSVPLTGVAADSVYATMSPFQHIAGVGNVLITLAVGAALVGVRRFSAEAWSGLAAFGVTHALLVPTMVDLLLADGSLGLPSLQMLQYGGAPIHPDTLGLLTRSLPDVRLVQIYGTTEGSPITCLRVDDHRRAAAGRHELLLSNGQAAPETEVGIMEPDAEGIGEVCCRSPHVHVGSADGWLHTGDLGRLDDQGYLYLSGRKNDRIIRGGENVDPLEVEQVLRRHPAVADAAVVGTPDRRLGEIVTAWVVPAGPEPPDPEEMRTFARGALAGFKVPEIWNFTDDLPRNENGKLLRRHLRSEA